MAVAAGECRDDGHVAAVAIRLENDVIGAFQHALWRLPHVAGGGHEAHDEGSSSSPVTLDNLRSYGFGQTSTPPMKPPLIVNGFIPVSCVWSPVPMATETTDVFVDPPSP